MKILVLTKRQYMGKDLLDDRFGRFRELPLELARLGHEVQGLSLSYRPRRQGEFTDGNNSAGASVIWHSVNLLNGFSLALGKYPRGALALAREFRPDVIWACSDAYHAIFGSWLAKHVRTPCVIDLYDDFETFTASQFPGVLPLFRRAVRAADGVSVFSRRLADYVERNYPRAKPTSVIENGIRKDLFYPRDRNLCRRSLGLPENYRIIGTAGALDRSRGIEALFKAFEILSAEADDLHLALAGPRQRGLRIPTGLRVHDFKELPHPTVPLLINALDLAVVCYRRSAQGEVSFPQKAYEILACRVPLVAAAVGSMNELLATHPQCLFEPDDPHNLAAAAKRQLENRTAVDVPTPSWADSARQLADFFEKVVNGNPLPLKD
jgi:glycosyltransferase involved in cell wall biosynthesis